MIPIPQNSTNPIVEKLFSSVQNNVVNNYLSKGSLITFNYLTWKHDPYPLLIVTDVFMGNMIRGVNLHYLTFPYIKNILKLGASNYTFSYSFIKGDKYIVDAFRSYKWNGIRQVKYFDSKFLLTMIENIRSFDPNQIAAMRKSVQDQIMREINAPAIGT